MPYLRPVLAASAVALAASSGAPASAANCAGTEATAVVCAYPENVSISPTGGPGVNDCVNLGGPAGTCHVPVSAAGPSVSVNGPLYSADCNACDDAGPIVDDAVQRAREAVADAAVFVQNVRDSIRDTDCLPMSATDSAVRDIRDIRIDDIAPVRCV